MRNLKKFLALVLALMMVMGLTMTANAAASDINGEVTDEYETAIDVLFQLKILHGGDNGYLSDKPIMRSEFAMMLYRLHSGFTSDADSKVWAQYSTFTDVDENAWYAGAVGYAQEFGLLSGVGDYKFDPDGYVDGYQVLAGLLKVLGYNAKDELTGSAWRGKTTQYAGTGKADLIGKLVSGTNLGASATRETVAQLFFYTLMAKPAALDAQGNLVPDTSAATKSLGEDKFKMTVLENTAASNDAAGKQDAFGRPAASKIVKVGDKVVDSELSQTKIATYNTRMAAGAAKTDLAAKKVTEVDDNVKVYVNGYDITNVSWNGGSITAGKNNILSGSRTTSIVDYLLSANNNVVEIYVDKTTNKIKTVVGYNIFVNKLGAAKDTTAGTITLTDTWMTGWPGSSTAVAYKVDGDFAKDDIVLYTHGWDDGEGKIVAGDAWKATAVTEGILTKITDVSGSPKTYTVNGEIYEISDALSDGNAGGVTLTAADYGKEYTYYIDPNNNTIVYVDKTGADTAPSTPSSDYAIVTGISVTAEVEKDAFTGQDAGEVKVDAILRLLTHGGAVEELPIKVVKSTAGTDTNAGKEMIGTVVKNASAATAAGSYYLYVNSGSAAAADDYILVWDASAGSSVTANGIKKWDDVKATLGTKAYTYKLDKDGNVELTVVKAASNSASDAAGTYYTNLNTNASITKDTTVVTMSETSHASALINNSTVFILKNEKGDGYTTLTRSTLESTEILQATSSGVKTGSNAILIVAATGETGSLQYVVKYVIAQDALFVPTVPEDGADDSDTVVFVTGTSTSEYVDGKTVWTYEVYDLEGNKDELVYEPTQAHPELTRGYYALKTDGTLSDTAKTANEYALRDATVSDIYGADAITVGGETYNIEGAEIVYLDGATKIEVGAKIWAVLTKSGVTVTKNVRILFVTPKAS